MSHDPIVRVDEVTYAYPEASNPVLHDLSFALDAASFTLLGGRSGSGKSTVLRLLNGLVPHFSGGRFAGNVRVAGRDTRLHGPRDLATTVGFVFQDPEAQMLTDRVEDEIAFGMEQAGIPPLTMRKRVEEALDLLRIGHLRERSPATLSGGERQRVAIASAMVMHPQVLVLDEPTSQLDPWSADDVLTVIQRLNDDLGTTILMAEHRLERTLPLADALMLLGEGKPMPMGPARALITSLSQEALPPVAHLGVELGWQPIPLTVKEGRRAVGATYPSDRESLRESRIAAGQATNGSATYPAAGLLQSRSRPLTSMTRSCAPEPRSQGFRRCGPCGRFVNAALGRSSRLTGGHDRSGEPGTLSVEQVTVRRGGRDVLRDCSLRVDPGELVALMGRNGSGKTSLLRVIAGIDQPVRGRVSLAGPQRPGAIGYVPQQPGALLWHETVRADLRFAIAAARKNGVRSAREGDAEDDLRELGIGDLADRHPRDLSVGERVRAAIAVALAGQPDLLLLDEPTRGMDWEAKATLMRLLKRLTSAGVPVVVATHDVELMARWADRVVLLGDREIVAMGPPAEVLANSLTFSTQMNTLLGGTVLTVEDAVRALGRQAADR